MAQKIDTKLIIFGNQRKHLSYGRLKIEAYPGINYLQVLNGKSNPLSFKFLYELKDCDVIHLYGLRKDSNLIAAMYGKIKDKKIFVTDLGWNGFCISRIKILERIVDGFLPLTKFDRKVLKNYKKPSWVIYGGVDIKKFLLPRHKKKPNRVLFIGRIMPHKGINCLIDAVDKSIDLHVLGKINDQKYFSYLKKLAKRKQVCFITSANDKRIVREYQEAIVSVLPSVYRDIYGKYYPKPELFGLVLIEAMACGTPVIATRVGALPDVVENGKVGFIIPPNDSLALREKIQFLLKNPGIVQTMGTKGRNLVLEKFTWDKVAKRCLDAYSRVLQKK